MSNELFDVRRTRTWAEIDLDALMNNICVAKKYISAGDSLYAVVKSNAYGHGATAVSSFIEREKAAEGLAVATPDEALELRNHGVKLPILILGYSHPTRLGELMEAGEICPTVFSLESAAELSDAATRYGKTVDFFLAVDSGMGRIGVHADRDGFSETVAIAALPKIHIAGVFSHFACADAEDRTDARLQEERFSDFCASLEASGIKIPIKSLYNSAAVVLPEFSKSYGIVRLGISMYGLHPSGYVLCEGLLPVMSLRSRIVQIRTVGAGQGISYGHAFTATSDMRVATVSVGYGDGYPRLLSGKAHVLVRGKRCPVLGRICMDMMMIDVSDLPEAQMHDVVTLFGRDGNEYISADDLAESVGTIGYELINGISPRVPRVYSRGERYLG